jgi:hypothetical protein
MKAYTEREVILPSRVKGWIAGRYRAKANEVGRNEKVLLVADQGIGDQAYFLKILQDNVIENNQFYLIIDKRVAEIFRNKMPSNYYFTVKREIYEHISRYILLADLALPLIAKRLQLISTTNNINTFQLPSLGENRLEFCFSWISKSSKYGDLKSLKDSDLYLFFNGLDNYRLPVTIYLIDEPANRPIFNQAKFKNIIFKKLLISDFDSLEKLIENIKKIGLLITASNSYAHIAAACDVKTIVLHPNFEGILWFWKLHELGYSPYKWVIRFTPDHSSTTRSPIDKLLEYIKSYN